MNTESAVAWSLRAPSATGGKDYRILVFDCYLVIGWGSRIGTMQYKVNKVSSPEFARELAIVQTSRKEKAGYVLTLGPTRSNRPASEWAAELPKHLDLRGMNGWLDHAFKILLIEGTPLAS